MKTLIKSGLVAIVAAGFLSGAVVAQAGSHKGQCTNIKGGKHCVKTYMKKTKHGHKHVVKTMTVTHHNYKHKK